MTKDQKSADEKAVFRYRRDQARQRLPRYATMLLLNKRPDFTDERVYNVLRTPIRCYDEEVLQELESLAGVKVAA